MTNLHCINQFLVNFFIIYIYFIKNYRLIKLRNIILISKFFTQTLEDGIQYEFEAGFKISMPEGRKFRKLPPPTLKFSCIATNELIIPDLTIYVKEELVCSCAITIEIFKVFLLLECTYICVHGLQFRKQRLKMSFKCIIIAKIQFF